LGFRWLAKKNFIKLINSNLGTMKKSILLFLIFGVLCSITSCNNLQDRIDKQVKSMDGMAQLGTVEYTITKIVKVDDNAFYKIGDRKILFSCRAYMKAGIDLADFTTEDVKLDKKSNSIHVQLPQPKVLSFNMPLDEAKLEYESVSTLRSDFTTEDRMNFLKQGEENILADVENLGILHDAEKNATLFFESLFASLGVEEVKITFKEEK
jgi:hypothetical protein